MPNDAVLPTDHAEAASPVPIVRKRVNLALQGGGAHGAFTWGVLDRLLDEAVVHGDRLRLAARDGGERRLAVGQIELPDAHEAAIEAQPARAPALDKLKGAGMQILPPSAQLKADMKKVGDTMLKEWLEKAGPEGKQLLDAYTR